MTIHALALTTLTNTAKDFRNDLSAIVFGATSARPTGARSGVRYGTPTDTVTVVGSAGTIKPHAGIMDVQTSAAAGPYWYAVTANESFTVDAAHATNPRIDIVTIRINDNVEDSSGLESATSHYKAGTAAASPVAPTPDTTREMVIATLTRQPVSAGGAVTVSWVAPYAVAAGGIIPVRTTTELAALWAAYPPTTDAPVITTRKDAAAAKIIEYSVDGTNKYVVDARLSTDPDPLLVRAAYTYRPANTAALGALTGMRAGDTAYQVDTGVTYRYNGAAWKAWESDWITYTPTLTNFAIGTGGSAANSCAYRYEQGTVRVNFKFQFGTSGFSVSGDPIFTLPLNSAALAHTYVKRQGQAELWDSSGASISREAVIYQNAANLDKVMLYGLGTATSGTVYNISSTLPFTWAAADILAGEFTYTAA